MTGHAPYRLPRTVIPERYELTLAPNVEALTFAGQARIRISVTEPVVDVVVNAAGLDIAIASLVDDDGTVLTGKVRYDEAEEQATIVLSAPATPGCWLLDLAFAGTLDDMPRGLFRTMFSDMDGAERVIVASQFEPTHARRAFPCWDEPDLKATFAVTLVVDAPLTAISNAVVVADRDLGDGKRQITFDETPPMSTYLVAVVVGPFEITDPVDVDGVPIRIATTPGKQHLTNFAVEAATHAIRFLARYFVIRYPHTKLDHVALPDFAPGAMENLGCITYQETALLVDPAAASPLELREVTEVVAHETAHMWFGDLVTMRWWDGIWLNEAFATFMQLLVVDARHPEWQVWTTFGLARNRALTTDGLRTTRPIEYPVVRPSEVEAMFDVLTYQKGAALLRMLEQHLGAELFREGVHRYLFEHRHANTDTSDLWNAIETASGQPVRAIMDGWIHQPGYPLISVGLSSDGRRLTLGQRRFRYRADAESEDRERGGRWQVPVNLRLSAAGRVTTARLVLSGWETTVALPADLDWVVVNAGGWGFYRVLYDNTLLRRLMAVAQQELSALERLNLVSDAAAAMQAGHLAVTEFLNLVVQLAPERDPDVWAVAFEHLRMLDRILSDGDRPLLQAFVRQLLQPAVDEVGWQPSPNEHERIGVLRARAVTALGTIGADPKVQLEATSRFALYLADPTTMPAELTRAVLTVVGFASGEDDYQRLCERFRLAPAPQEQLRFLYSLAAPEDPDLLSLSSPAESDH